MSKIHIAIMWGLFAGVCLGAGAYLILMDRVFVFGAICLVGAGGGGVLCFRAMNQLGGGR